MVTAQEETGTTGVAGPTASEGVSSKCSKLSIPVAPLKCKSSPERCVLLVKQSGGYGFTVTEGYPIYVDSVRSGAFHAGIRRGDCIVKVNGMPVTASNLPEVLSMIAGGETLALTLRSPPDFTTPPPNHSALRGEQFLKEQKGSNGIGAPNGYALYHPELATSICRTNYGEASKVGTLPVHKVEPVRSWVNSGGMHYMQAHDAVSMDDDEMEELEDEEDDGEGNLLAEPLATGPFADLSELRMRPAHLAVFMNFLVSSGDANSLLFFLIADSYHNSNNAKETRRYAYEIFSTFLIPGAPLQIPNISQSLIQAIDKVLRATAMQVTSNDLDQLRKLFIPSKRRAIDDISNSLGEFRRKRAMGLAGLGMELYHQLENIARADHATELRIAEQVLFKTLDSLFVASNISGAVGASELETCDPRGLALIISIATVIKVVLGLKPSYGPWERQLDKCPTFLTVPKTTVTASTVLSRVMPKRAVQIKEHQFSLSPISLTLHCYQCRALVWGINPQAYVCQNCAVAVHKQCAPLLVDSCYAQQQQKSTSKTTGGIFGGQMPVLDSSSSAIITNKHADRLMRPSLGSTTSLNQPHLPASLPPLASSHQQQHRVEKSGLMSREEDMLAGVSTSGYVPPPEQQQKLRQKQSPSHSWGKKRGCHELSLTPPQVRSHAPVSPSALHHHHNRLDDEDASDALIDTVQSSQEAMPTPSVASTKGAGAATTTAASSPSTTSMLPPPVFSQKFERIVAPEPPLVPPPLPTSPPPPLLDPIPPLRSSCIVVENVKSTSSDSGIGHEVVGADGRVIVTRAQSMRVTPVTTRTGRGANSLGASDSRVNEEPPAVTMHHLAVNKTASDSSAEHLPSMAASIEVLPSAVVTRGEAASAVDIEPAEERSKMIEKAEQYVIEDNDPDLEVETEVPSLESIVDAELLRLLKPKEKKRQEVVNELFHTERTHLRNLKVLHKVFYLPICRNRLIQTGLVGLLFGNIDDLLEVHNEMYSKMKEAMQKWSETVAETGMPYGDIGQLVEEIFVGSIGEKLEKAISDFCQHQQHALDALRLRYNRAKDDPLSIFLTEAEQNPLCRKLQLKDMIPVEMQRLVKYPLLLETIAKYTQDPSDELQHILNAVSCAKRILSAVNAAKRNAENSKRLGDLQGRLELELGGGASFFQHFDLREHKLIHDGQLVWRQTRGKNVELHVVLLEHLIVFLTKSGDGGGCKLQLRIHEPGCIPVMRLASVEVEEKATDKRVLNLMYKCDLRLFELIAPTINERKTWQRLIENQVAVIGGGSSFSDFPRATAYLSAPNDSGPLSSPSLSQHGVARAVTVGGEDDLLEGGEHVHVMMHPQLVNANAVTVQQPRVMEHAQPNLTPFEKLERNDSLIINALVEKHQLLAGMLEGVKREKGDELEKITEQLVGLAVAELKQRNPREVALAAIVQGNRLLDSINRAMTKQDQPASAVEQRLPSVPCYKLAAIAAPLMNHLKAMMAFVQEQETEIARLRGQPVGDDDGNSSLGRTLLAAPSQLNPSPSPSGQNLVLRSN